MAPNPSQVSILMVDDYPSNLVTLAAVLESLGQRLVGATSGKEALEYVREEDFAVILLDVQMPEMDGFETARQIRALERARETPIIFVTALHRSREYESQGYALGAVDYVSKPFDPEVLRPRVAALVEVAKRNRSIEQLGHARLAAILQSALDAMITVDAGDRIVEWNPAAERTFGYSRAEALGQDLCDLVIPPVYRASHRAGLERHLATGEVTILGQRLELTALHADGHEFPVELTVTRIPGEGAPLFTGYMRDLTQQKQAERRLAAQYAVAQVLVESPTLAEALPRLLRAVGENTDWEWGAYWQVDPAAQVLRPAVTWGTARQELDAFAQQTLASTFPPGSGLPGRVWSQKQPLWVRNILRHPDFPRAAAGTRAGFHAAVAFPITSGSRIVGVMEFFSRHLGDPDTELLQLLGALGHQIGQFIQRKEIEADLEERERRLRHLQSVTDVALVHLSSEDLLRELLQRISHILQADTATLLLIDEDEVFVCASHGLAAEGEQDLRIPLGQGVAGRIAATCEPLILNDLAQADADSPLLREHGIQSLLGVPLLLEGRVLGVLHVGTLQPRHFTAEDTRLLQLVGDRAALAIEHARVLRELHDANIRKTDFLSMLAHEVRTPLSAISNALYILEHMEIPDDRAGRQLVTMHRQTRQLARLIEDLMDISRINKGKVDLRRESVAICRIAREGAEAIRPLADARGQELECDLAPETLLVHADAARLEQVITNLLNNAVKYTQPGGRIWLSVQRDGAEAVVRVRDTGVGIDPPQLPLIFDLFHQVEQVEARTAGGMGIGLALVKRLMELHGGRIEAHSEGRGKGAEFSVRLPLLAVEPEGIRVSTSELI